MNLQYTRGWEDEAYFLNEVSRVREGTDMTRVQLPGAIETQLSYIYYGARNVPQGRERARSSVDVAVERPIMNDRAELIFTLTDIFNDFAVEHEVDGQGFTAIYQNFRETQVATLGLRVRF